MYRIYSSNDFHVVNVRMHLLCFVISSSSSYAYWVLSLTQPKCQVCALRFPLHEPNSILIRTLSICRLSLFLSLISLALIARLHNASTRMTNGCRSRVDVINTSWMKHEAPDRRRNCACQYFCALRVKDLNLYCIVSGCVVHRLVTFSSPFKHDH